MIQRISDTLLSFEPTLKNGLEKAVTLVSQCDAKCAAVALVIIFGVLTIAFISCCWIDKHKVTDDSTLDSAKVEEVVIPILQDPSKESIEDNVYAGENSTVDLTLDPEVEKVVPQVLQEPDEKSNIKNEYRAYESGDETFNFFEEFNPSTLDLSEAQEVIPMTLDETLRVTTGSDGVENPVLPILQGLPDTMSKIAEGKDYTFESKKNLECLKMTINTTSKPITIFVTPFNDREGYYSILLPKNTHNESFVGTFEESLNVYTAPQLCAMYRFLNAPDEGFRLSRISSKIKKTGLMIFKNEKNSTYHIFNDEAEFIRINMNFLKTILEHKN